MRLPNDASDETSLACLGTEAARLLQEENFQGLADRFGYALAYGEDPAIVIRAELTSCLSQSGNGAQLLAHQQPRIIVSYFTPNETKLFALVECWLALADDAGHILAELIVTTMDDGKHVFLEQISLAA